MNTPLNPTKYYSSIQEKQTSDYLGWKVVAGSGSRPGMPGDIEGDEWLGECKTHTSPDRPILFARSVWDKLVKESMMKHRSPVLIVDDGSQKIEHTWCLCFEHSLNFDRYSAAELDIRASKNITFKHHDMVSEGDVFRYNWCKDKVLVVSLLKFKSILEEDN